MFIIFFIYSLKYLISVMSFGSKNFLIEFCIIISFLFSCKQKIELNDSNELLYKVEKVLSHDGIIWSIEFIDENKIIFTDKSGKIFTYDGEDKKEIIGAPEIYLNRQGGLMDIELHPNFNSNKIIYLTYAKKLDESGGNTALARGVFDGDKIVNLKDIFVSKQSSEKGTHWGSRIEFNNEGHLFFAIGDRGSRDINPQDLYRDAGKVFRINDDGSIPSDNPYVNKIGINPAIYSYGHRNPQGIFLHPKTNEIWTNEHGPRGGDEINIIDSENNYGWPIISYGINYDSSIFTSITKKEGMEEPLYYWVPSIAPSCFEYLDSDKYEEWNGSLLVGSLNYGYVERLTMNIFGQINYREKLAPSIGRVRDIKVSPSGYIHISVEKDGIYKITPI